MENVHLAAEDEDDLYSGYNDYNPTFDSEVRTDCDYCDVATTSVSGLYCTMQ